MTYFKESSAGGFAFRRHDRIRKQTREQTAATCHARQSPRVARRPALPQVVAAAVAAIPKAVCALRLPTIRQLAAAPPSTR